ECRITIIILSDIEPAIVPHIMPTVIPPVIPAHIPALSVEDPSSPEHAPIVPSTSPFLFFDSFDTSRDYSGGDSSERPPSHDPYEASIIRWRSKVAVHLSSPRLSLSLPSTPVLHSTPVEAIIAPSTAIAPSIAVEVMGLSHVMTPARSVALRLSRARRSSHSSGSSPSSSSLSLDSSSSSSRSSSKGSSSDTPASSREKKSKLRPMVPATLVPLPAHPSGALSPVHAERSPPRKRFRGPLAASSHEGSIEESSGASIEPDINSDILGNIEANIAADATIAVEAKAKVKAEAEVEAEVEVEGDDEAEDDAEFGASDTIKIGVDVVTEPEVLDDIPVSTIAERLSKSENRDDNRNGNGGGNQNGNGGENRNGNGGGNGNVKGRGNGNNGNNNKNGNRNEMNGGAGGGAPVARICTYKDFLNCQPRNFSGTKGVVGLARMVLKEEDKIKRFIWGIPCNIQRNMTSSKPTRLQDAIKIANSLMDKKQPPFKRQNVARAYTVGNNKNNEKRGYAGSLIYYNKCKLHHEGQCIVRCINCKKGHYKSDCPKLKSQNLRKQDDNSEAYRRAYALGGGEANPDSNIVTDTFLINNRYAYILFDLGADRSFVSTTFSSLIDIIPTTLDVSYAVELANERIARSSTVIKGCTLNLLDHPFNIELMPVELDRFDVIICMDWLSKYHAVIVCDCLRFKDPDFPNRVYKVEKALYGLHQAPRAWHKGDILLVQVYVDDIIFGSTKKELCNAFEKLMYEKFQMSSMGELTLFLGLQVKQKMDGTFISQDKYVAEILKKFRFTKVKTASTPMETQKPLLKDEDGKEVDVHMYRSTIGSLMYLTSLIPDIMFAVCTCARYQVNPKVSHLHDVKRIFRYLKGQPKLGFWYPKDSPFDLVAYTDSDYAGASLDRKSTIGGCQFLGCRLISWLCKKQIVVVNSTTEAKYVAASSCCGQFWSIVMVKTINGEAQLHARVDGKKIIITEASTRRDLQLDDEEGVDCLPNSTIFKQLALIGVRKGFSGRVTPLFPTMVVQYKFGKGSAMPTDLHHIPTILQSSSSQPQKTHKPTKPIRNVTQVPQPSDLIEHVADKAIHKEFDDILVRAATTASTLEAEQDSGNINKTQSKATPNKPSSQGTDLGGGLKCQETIGDTTTQTRFESVSKHSNDLLLARGNTLQSDEDIMKLNELMALCITLQNRVLELEKTKTSQHNEIGSLKRRVKKLEKRNSSRTHKLKRLYKVGLTARVESLDDEKSLGKDASKQGRRIDAIDADADDEIILVNNADNEMFDVDDLGGEEVFVTEQKVVSTAATTTTITTKELTLAQALEALKTSKPKAKGVIIQEPSESTTTIPKQQSQNKGKGIMIEEPVKPKKKDQIRNDEEAAKRLQAEFDEEERLAREKAKKEQEANIALIKTWDDIQAKIDVDYQLAERLQAQEQKELSDAKKATLFQQLLEKRIKNFTAKKAEQKRNKPPTQAH
nr:uncharacterized mitochondrial protein AtMg00810-like [Tanacetum cinerariifolium]